MRAGSCMVARSGNASAIWVYTAGRALSTAYISTPSMIVPFNTLRWCPSLSLQQCGMAILSIRSFSFDYRSLLKTTLRW